MSETPSLMLSEANEAAAVVADFLSRERTPLERLGAAIADLKPRVVTTSARGSSDHAAAYFKYLFEIHTGVPVASIGPSIASVYGTPLQLRDALHVSISQSGSSPDIVALQAAAKAGGAMTVAFVNVTDSPLAEQADFVVPLHAGLEKSVAATKSFVASTAALAALTAAVARDAALWSALDALPATLDAQPKGDFAAMEVALIEATSLFTTGRGPSYAIALEAALKAKETAALHAEAFSLAEVMHGPMRLIEGDFPVVAFVPDDAAFDNSADVLQRLGAMGALTASLSTSPLACPGILCAPTGSGFIDPIVSIVAFYRVIERVTRARGFDPDTPRNLKKVTMTV